MVKYENLKLKINKVSIELNISTFHVVDYLLSLILSVFAAGAIIIEKNSF